MAKHLYWRANMRGNNAAPANPFCDIQSVELAQAVGGPNLSILSAGTPIGSSSKDPTKAFDQNGNTAWDWDGSGQGWLGFKFRVPVEINEFRIESYGAYSPFWIDFEYSDDGVTWFYMWTSFAVSNWNGLRSFARPAYNPPNRAHRYWALLVVDSRGRTYTSISDLKLRGVAGGPSLSSDGAVAGARTFGSGAAGGPASNGTFYNANAFDGDPATRWASDKSQMAHSYLIYDFGAGNAQKIVEAEITAIDIDTGPSGGETPVWFALAYSDDNVNYYRWGEYQGSFFAASRTATFLPNVSNPDDKLGHRYWRYRHLQTPAAQQGANEIHMASAVGGPNLCVNGTALTNTTYGGYYGPDKAFNNDTGTGPGEWAGSGRLGWIGYDFGEERAPAIEEIRICPFSDTSLAFTIAVVESSDDGVIWSPEWLMKGPNWSYPNFVSFKKPRRSNAQRYWAMFNEYGSGFVSGGLEYRDLVLMEMEFRSGTGEDKTVPGGALTVAPGNAYGANNAIIDNDTSTYFYTSAFQGTFIGYDFVNTTAITSIKMVRDGGDNANRAPGQGWMAQSEDGLSYAIVRAYKVPTETWSDTLDLPVVNEGLGHRFWRFKFDSVFNSGRGCCVLFALAFRGTPGGPNLATGGTGFSDAICYGGDGNAAFADGYFHDCCGTGGKGWIGYDFGVPTKIVEFAATSWNRDLAYDDSPKTGGIEWSDDAITWTRAWSIPEQAAWGSSERRSFTQPPAAYADVGGHRYWRARMAADGNPGGEYTGISRLQFYRQGKVESFYGGANNSGGVQYGSGVQVTSASSDNSGLIQFYGGAPDQWVSYDFGEDHRPKIDAIRVAPNRDAVSRTWTKIALEYSDDNVNWTTAGVAVPSLPWTAEAQTLDATFSYGNFLGTGDRKISLTVGGSVLFNTPWNLAIVDGTVANDRWFASGQSNVTLSFDLGETRVIKEATWYQDNNANHGDWRWQGSQNGADWTDIGGDFQLGGTPTKVIQTLSGNNTAYRFYRMQQKFGTTSSAPYTQEITFLIDGATKVLETYHTKYGYGDRRAFMSVETDARLTGTIAGLIDGTQDENVYFEGSDSNRQITFTFDKPIIVTEAKWSQSTLATHGTWKWQGSTDKVEWADIGGTFVLGDNGGEPQRTWNTSYHTTLRSNRTEYRFYRLQQVDGFTHRNPWLYEIQFRTLYIPPEPPQFRRRQEILVF